MNDYFSSAVNTIKEWVNIKSVKSKATGAYPFGEDIQKMLEKALSDAKNMGFEVVNYDNYIAEVIFGSGSDEDGLAVLCHLDTVPEGDLNKWNTNPFDAQIIDGYLYGRGVVDNKGPAVLCLYALKELKDSGFKPNRKIKLILGLDEESGWQCIEHYNKVAVMPKEGFTPDGSFPIIYAEKGILHVEFSFDINSDKIISLHGGDTINMVCDLASCKLKNFTKKSLNTNDAIYIDETIVAKGRTAHGSTPHIGDNAIDKILKFLAQNGYIDNSIYTSLFENGYLFSGIEDETGKLTFSPNVIRYENGVLKVKTDIRFPSTYKKEEIESILSKIANYTVLSYNKPLLVEKESSLVKTLLNIYNEEYGVNEKPKAIGGGTYAKALEKGVAFGFERWGDSCCHVPNEKASISHLEKSYKIFKRAIEEMAK